MENLFCIAVVVLGLIVVPCLIDSYSRHREAAQTAKEQPPDNLDYTAAIAYIDRIQDIRERLNAIEKLLTYLDSTPLEQQAVTCSTPTTLYAENYSYTFYPSDSTNTAALQALRAAAEAERKQLRQSLSSLLQELPKTTLRSRKNRGQNVDET